jgi:exopolysaccharide biosynthesis polyprenyl glycosylphosphotransferase
MTVRARDDRTSQEGQASVARGSAGSRPVVDPGGAPRPDWRGAYVRRTVAADALCAAAAAVVGYVVRFGPADAVPSVGSLWTAVLLPAVWVIAMLVARCYERRFLWVGAEEFRRVFIASMMLLATVGTVSWAFKLEVARGFVVLALPLATFLTLGQRYLQRQWVHHGWGNGRNQQTALLVGHRSGVDALHEQIVREASHGYRVVGCCLPGRPVRPESVRDMGIPVLGTLDEVADVVIRHGVDTVAVLPCPELEGFRLRRLGWELEKTDAELLLAPALTEVAGPRVRIRPVCGLPLLHMERPELRGVRRLAKECVDLVGALLGLFILLPVLLGIAVAIKIDSRGPVLYRQQRVGRDGCTFGMLKFRSMVRDADERRKSLSSLDEGNGILFKVRADPRVTRVGRVLRRYSLDELPQLINVLRGEMSLVGPRPPLPSEAERYGMDMHRRFLVKPGLTGLWQVSGRSNLSWDDSVRIDVRYVENWSLTFDLMILWKTMGAVIRGRGAY